MEAEEEHGENETGEIGGEDGETEQQKTVEIRAERRKRWMTWRWDACESIL